MGWTGYSRKPGTPCGQQARSRRKSHFPGDHLVIGFFHLLDHPRLQDRVGEVRDLDGFLSGDGIGNIRMGRIGLDRTGAGIRRNEFIAWRFEPAGNAIRSKIGNRSVLRPDRWSEQRSGRARCVAWTARQPTLPPCRQPSVASLDIGASLTGKLFTPRWNLGEILPYPGSADFGPPFPPGNVSRARPAVLLIRRKNMKFILRSWASGPARHGLTAASPRGPSTKRR